MKHKAVLLFLVFLVSAGARAQVSTSSLEPIFDQPIQSAAVWGSELRQYAAARVPKLPRAVDVTQWTRQAQILRERFLSDVVYHGWPREWVNALPKFQLVGIIEGKGYRIEKLRYEIVPGFWSTALLYEPANLTGKVPAVMSLIGHFSKGKAMDFNQVLCVNYALRGMIALTPEWIDMGELRQPENDHIKFEAALDLVGVSPVGLFYLAMKRPLDYLAENPHVDNSRIGVTGLSGGGWQTIMLSALDPRVKAAIPVAGFQSVFSDLDKISAPGRPAEGIGDMEQNPTDFYTVADYPALVAMRAPRPTLLIYDATDDCCFRAPLVKPYVFDEVRPFFELYGKKDSLQWYENLEPGTHNYELNNREQSYRFFAQAFGLPIPEREIPVQTEIRSYDELRVGVPSDNLTILGLAKRFAAEIHHPSTIAPKSTDVVRLRSVVRYQPVTVKRPWAIANTRAHGLESIAYRFQFSNGLSATGIWLKEIDAPKTAPLVLFMDDKGMKAAIFETNHGMPRISDLLERGNQVLAFNLLFTPVSPQRGSWAYPELLSAMGERALGMEIAQLIAIVPWAQSMFSAIPLDAETYGIRDEVIALAASALKPKLFSRITIHDGMRSLQHLLDAPVTYDQAPDLFCPDFYKEFDLDQLRAMAAPMVVHGLHVPEIRR